ncbi:spidroin-2 [Desulfovibrio sp.]|uniref:spidroin-2 n=1 Tax=Desulfovibrio sp. TaxID=885 RepID=UPI0025BF58D4|nr:spidroin-2 [Desulfovibrio sp.]
MQNIPEWLFYWQWASGILSIGMNAAAALPAILALTLLAGRRGNARLCVAGARRLTRLALGLGLLGPLLTAANLVGTILSFGGSGSHISGLALWDAAVLPYTTTVLAWIAGLCCLWFVTRMDRSSPLAIGLPTDNPETNPGVRGSKGRSARKGRKSPLAAENEASSNQLDTDAMRSRLFLYLLAVVCFFAAHALPNWSFSGPPQGLDWGRMASAVLGTATHDYFTNFAPAGAMALLALSLARREFSGSSAAMPGNRAFSAADLEKAARWAALWAMIGYVPRCIDRWGLFIGLSFSGQTLPDWLMPQITGLVPLTLAVACWTILFTLRSRMQFLWLNWLALALLVIRQSLPFITALLHSAA